MRNMQTPKGSSGTYLGTPRNPPPAFPRESRRRIAACILLLCVLVGCSPATAPDGSEARRFAAPSRGELNELIDSLANRNEKPTMVAVRSAIAPLSDNPLFAEGYDWDEDTRVWLLVWEFEKYNSEDLWRCPAEHVDDERYVLAYASDDYARIASIGGLCRSQALSYLSGPFMTHLPRSMDGNAPAMRPFSPKQVGPRCHGHAGVPLYKQQVELCEAAVEKMQAMPRIPDADKTQFAADVKRQIGVLLRTKQPWITSRGLLPNGGDIKSYDAAAAKEIRGKYLAEQGARQQNVK